jgi:hypothetical protein
VRGLRVGDGRRRCPRRTGDRVRNRGGGHRLAGGGARRAEDDYAIGAEAPDGPAPRHCHAAARRGPQLRPDWPGGRCRDPRGVTAVGSPCPRVHAKYLGHSREEDAVLDLDSVASCRASYPAHDCLRAVGPVVREPRAGLWLVLEHDGAGRAWPDRDGFNRRPSSGRLVLAVPPRLTRPGALVSQALIPAGGRPRPRVEELPDRAAGRYGPRARPQSRHTGNVAHSPC